MAPGPSAIKTTKNVSLFTSLGGFFSAVYHERRSFFAALYLMAIALFFQVLMYIAEFEANLINSAYSAHDVVVFDTLNHRRLRRCFSCDSPRTNNRGFHRIVGVCTVALLTGIVASAFQIRSPGGEQFSAEISSALSDGILTESEERHIESLRKEFKIRGPCEGNYQNRF